MPSKRIYLVQIGIVCALTLMAIRAAGWPQTRVSAHPASARGPRFNVKDSIQMQRFERRSGDALFSPDRKHFALVTSRGILQTDEVESTLWLFNSDRVRQYLRHELAHPPVPQVLARFRALPQADYSDSYASIVSSVRWLADSGTLLFLAQNRRGERQLYSADIRSGSVQALSKQGFDVNQYANAGETLAYLATNSNQTVSLGHYINRDAMDVTGLAWSSFLFVDALAANSLRCNELWILRNTRSSRVAQGQDRRSCLVNRFDQILSLSPDGRFAVIVSSVQHIPESWRSYRSTFPDRRIDPTSPDATAPGNPLRLTQYELIGLEDGRRRVLVDAPNAWSLGFPDANGAIWSHDGQKLMLLNTFLPFDVSTTEERTKRINPCTAALVELASQTSTCLAFSDYPERKLFLTSASFTPDDNSVSLDYWGPEIGRTRERVDERDGRWQETGHIGLAVTESTDSPRSGRLGEPLSVKVKQDLNTPPTVWAAEGSSSEKIWDPNPRLANYELGEASIFKWRDQSGHEWTGGLVKPPDYISGTRYPLVIQTHGFIEGEFMTDGAYTTAFAARPLAAAGIVVLQMGENYNYRSLSQEAELQILGLESAIQRLGSDGVIDPDRVGIIGFSRTCYHVETALIKNPRLFAAAVISDGVDQSYMQEMLFGVGTSAHEGDEIYGAKPFGEGLKRWLESAPGFHLDRMRTPLLIEALRPESVLAEWEIYSSLTMQRKPVALFYFPQGQHILQRPLERLASQQGSVDWFRFWLKDEEHPEAVSARQYVTWRKMKGDMRVGDRK